MKPPVMHNFFSFAEDFTSKMRRRYWLSQIKLTVCCLALGAMIFTVLNWLGHWFLRSVGSGF